MMPNRSALIGNLVDYCKASPKRVKILNAVRKPKNYEAVAEVVGAGEAYCSNTLNHLKALGAVEPMPGERGFFRQTQLMKTIDIDSELKKAGKTPHLAKTGDSEIVKEVVRIFEIDKAADFLDLEPTIRNDCFPPREPFRKDVGEAYLTLEDFIRQELNLAHDLVGIKLVNEAAGMGLFNRDVQAEKNSLVELYHGAFGWVRNVAHHYKEKGIQGRSHQNDLVCGSPNQAS